MKKFNKNNDRTANKQYNKNYKGKKGFRKGNRRGPRDWTPPPGLSEYEKSVWLHSTFDGRVVKARYGENPEQLIRRFKKKVETAGIMREVKKREYYMTKSQKRREKRKRALKRLRKRLKIEERYDYDSKRPWYPRGQRPDQRNRDRPDNNRRPSSERPTVNR